MNPLDSKSAPSGKINGQPAVFPARQSKSTYGATFSPNPAGKHDAAHKIGKDKLLNQDSDSHSNRIKQKSSANPESGEGKFSAYKQKRDEPALKNVVKQQLGDCHDPVHSPENQQEFIRGKNKEDKLAISSPDRAQRRRKEKVRDPAAIDEEIKEARDVNELYAICERDIEQFTSANIATACARLAVVGQDTPIKHPIMERLADKAVANISKFKASELSGIASAFTEICLGSEEELEALFDALSREAQQKIRSFSTQDLANIARALAKFGIRNEEFFNVWAIQAKQNIQSFSVVDLANTARAIATFTISNELLWLVSPRYQDFFDAWAIQATLKIQSFSGENLAWTARAFARFGIHRSMLFDLLVIQARQKIESFSAEDLANIAWAFGSFCIHEVALFNALAIQAREKIENFSAQDLAKTAWAFARLNIREGALFSALEIQAQEQIQNFSVKDLANTAWAFAKLDIRNEALFNALAIQAQQKIHYFSAQDLANTAWAFAQLNIRNNALFNAVAIQAICRIGSVNGQSLRIIKGAFSAVHPVNEYWKIFIDLQRGNSRELQTRSIEK